MGTEITLKVSNVSLDYAKNNMGNDYGFLFQEGDLMRRRSDGINYEYYEEHPEKEGDLAEHELAFVRPLSRVLSRLHVLGHTVDLARAEYQDALDEAATYGIGEEGLLPLTFDEFCNLANRYPLASLVSENIEWDTLDRATVAQI